MFNMHNKKKIDIKLFINSFFILVNIAIKSTYKSTRGEKKYFYFLSAIRTDIILYQKNKKLSLLQHFKYEKYGPFFKQLSWTAELKLLKFFFNIWRL